MPREVELTSLGALTHSPCEHLPWPRALQGWHGSQHPWCGVSWAMKPGEGFRLGWVGA